MDIEIGASKEMNIRLINNEVHLVYVFPSEEEAQLTFSAFKETIEGGCRQFMLTLNGGIKVK
jgi:hypothetical protein